jgi:hypothetical protein
VKDAGVALVCRFEYRFQASPEGRVGLDQEGRVRPTGRHSQAGGGGSLQRSVDRDGGDGKGKGAKAPFIAKMDYSSRSLILHVVRGMERIVWVSGTSTATDNDVGIVWGGVCLIYFGVCPPAPGTIQ